MNLSRNFTLKEMTKSMTAQRRGIDNTPGSGEIKALGDLCYEILNLYVRGQTNLLQLLAAIVEALCEAIGSKKTSQHAKGQAVDLEILA
jgi:zinc D-Ala-D-Ala carboxypeptidase